MIKHGCHLICLWLPDAILEKDLKLDSERGLPALYEDSLSSLSENNLSSSAVMPSLPLAIKWLRDCVRESPSIRLQVRYFTELAQSNLTLWMACETSVSWHHILAFWLLNSFQVELDGGNSLFFSLVDESWE